MRKKIKKIIAKKPKPENFQVINQFIDSTKQVTSAVSNIGRNSLLNISNYSTAGSYANLTTNITSGLGSVTFKPENFQVINQFIDSTKQVTSAVSNIGRNSLLNISNYSTAGSYANLTTNITSGLGSVTFKPENFQVINQFIDSTKQVTSAVSNIGRNSLLNISNYSTASIHLSNISQFTIGPESSNLGSKLRLDFDKQRTLTESFLDLSKSYQNWIKSEKTPNTSTTYSELNRLSGIEYFGGLNLLKTISLEAKTSIEEELVKYEIEYENNTSLNEYLGKVDTKLYKMWRGAIEAYLSNNSDRIRHFSVSIRELFTHLIHKLAPDAQIKQWSVEKTHYDEKNRPTRKVRLLYLCRNIPSDTYKKFVEKDIDTTLTFFNIFQEGTHSLDPDLSESDMTAIRSKAESSLKFLLEIEFSHNNN